MIHSLVRVARGLYRRLPFQPLAAPLRWAYRRYQRANQDRTVVAEVDGITWALDLSEHIDAAIYYRGCFEQHTSAALKRLARPGAVVLDVGANIGAHTLPLARAVGPTGRVYAFEPMSWALAKLRRNLARNDFGNVVVEKLALSRETRPGVEVEFACRWPLEAPTDGSAHPYHGGLAMKETVDFMRLDDYAAAHDVARVDLIKLDVDGHEYKVVQGALATLRRDRPTLVMELGEYSVREAGDDVRNLVAALAGLGYRFYRESDFAEFPDAGSLLTAIPPRATINVVVSARPLT